MASRLREEERLATPSARYGRLYTLLRYNSSHTICVGDGIQDANQVYWTVTDLDQDCRLLGLSEPVG